MHGWWTASYVALWLLVGALALLVVALARQVGTLHLRLGPRGALEIDTEGPPLGEAPEPIVARDADGRPVSLGGPGRAQLLPFVSFVSDGSTRRSWPIPTPPARTACRGRRTPWSSTASGWCEPRAR